MKKLRPEFVAAMAQIVRFSADGEIRGLQPAR